MPRPKDIELPDGTIIPILFEDRSVVALDKPMGWLVAPDDWVNTRRNLFLALRSSLENGDWWARSRNLRFLRFVHRLDAETSGILLCVKSPGAVAAYSRLFEDRQVVKRYLAVVSGRPPSAQWTRRDPLGPEKERPDRFRVDHKHGKEAETRFRVLAQKGALTLLEAQPITGRTHQIRLHLLASGCPILGDELYGQPDPRGLGLRSVALEYFDPFQRRKVRIAAPSDEFCRRFGLAPPSRERSASTPPKKSSPAPSGAPSDHRPPTTNHRPPTTNH